MSQSFTFASWNIFQGLLHPTEPRRFLKNHDIEAHIDSLDADVLVLPEAWRFGQPDATWAEDMAAQMGYELHQWVSPTPSRQRELVPWRMVILTRIPARTLPAQVLTKSRVFGQRAILRVELTESELMLAGVHLYGIHLLTRLTLRGWMTERAELRQATAANDIVAGDFNMWGPVVRRDASALRSAIRGRTFPAKHPNSQIDHLLVSDRVEVLDGKVLGEMGSDHRALKATLRAR